MLSRSGNSHFTAFTNSCRALWHDCIMEPGENGERGQKKSMAQFQLKWVHLWLIA
jgi:hypothetical protein